MVGWCDVLLLHNPDIAMQHGDKSGMFVHIWEAGVCGISVTLTPTCHEYVESQQQNVQTIDCLLVNST